MIIERRRPIAAPFGQLHTDDGLLAALVADNALQLQPDVRPDAEMVEARLHEVVDILI